MSLNQMRESEHVSHVEFKWKLYDNEKIGLYFYQFKFYNKANMQVGLLQNMSSKVFQQYVL